MKIKIENRIVREVAREDNKKIKGRDERLTFEQAVEKFDEFFSIDNKANLYKFIIAKVEKPLIENVLNKTDGNKRKAAQILGMNRGTLYSKIKRLEINTKK